MALRSGRGQTRNTSNSFENKAILWILLTNQVDSQDLTTKPSTMTNVKLNRYVSKLFGGPPVRQMIIRNTLKIVTFQSYSVLFWVYPCRKGATHLWKNLAESSYFNSRCGAEGPSWPAVTSGVP